MFDFFMLLYITVWVFGSTLLDGNSRSRGRWSVNQDTQWQLYVWHIHKKKILWISFVPQRGLSHAMPRGCPNNGDELIAKFEAGGTYRDGAYSKSVYIIMSPSGLTFTYQFRLINFVSWCVGWYWWQKYFSNHTSYNRKPPTLFPCWFTQRLSFIL